MADLLTPRLVLKQITPEDAPAWRAFVGDRAVVEWTGSWPWPMDDDFLAMRLAKPFPEDRGYVASIWLGDLVIGTVALTDGELGYMLRRDQWGQGYAVEAARALLDYGFGTLGLQAIHAGSFDGNAASARVLEKLGFRHSGQGPAMCKSRGGELLCHDWQLTRADALAADPVFIRTDRMALRNMEDSDAEAYRALVTDPAVGPMLVIFPKNWTLEQAAEHIGENRFNFALKFRLAITMGGRFVGAIGCSGGDEPSIFYYFLPELHGQGLASEIVPAFTDMLLARFGIQAVRAGVFADNPRSGRVLEKAGFQRLEVGTWKSAARPVPAPMWHYRRPRA